MTDTPRSSPGDAAARLRAARPALVLVLAVFVFLWAFTGLAAPAAVGAFLAVVAAIMFNPLLGARSTGARRGGEPGPADPLAAYAVIADGLPDPCFLMDGTGNAAFQNEAARRLFGPIVPGQPLAFLLRDPEVGEAIRKVLATGERATVTFFERVPNERWFEMRASRLGAADGGRGDQPVHLVLLRDLTEARRVERMRADFVANASHELRTPLASLSGFIETLQGPARNDPAARERFLEVMAEQARRMSRLIDDLMSLSRIELKAHVPPQDVVDLAPIVEHVVDAMMPLAGESGVEILVDIPDRPLPVKGDRDELAQVFQNLVHNAIKYGQAGGRVEVAARIEPRPAGRPPRVSVAVADFGQGIPAEHLPRLTERFYRVDTATSRAKGGTGLGLAIVKHILNRHKGQLAIESEPGKGAVFRVALDMSNPQSGIQTGDRID